MTDPSLDITALIMDDHEWFRRQFAALDDISMRDQLEAVWTPLAARLELHASAEEEIFYPALLRRGDDAVDETDDAVRDHNKIREAIADAARHEVGSDEWFAAVGRARSENTEHLGEEEDEGLPDFRKNSTFEQRAQLGVRWVEYYATHSLRDASPTTVDPDRYLDENAPSAER